MVIRKAIMCQPRKFSSCDLNKMGSKKKLIGAKIIFRRAVTPNICLSSILGRSVDRITGKYLTIAEASPTVKIGQKRLDKVAIRVINPKPDAPKCLIRRVIVKIERIFVIISSVILYEIILWIFILVNAPKTC